MTETEIPFSSLLSSLKMQQLFESVIIAVCFGGYDGCRSKCMRALAPASRGVSGCEFLPLCTEQCYIIYILLLVDRPQLVKDAHSKPQSNHFKKKRERGLASGRKRLCGWRKLAGELQRLQTRMGAFWAVRGSGLEMCVVQAQVRSAVCLSQLSRDGRRNEKSRAPEGRVGRAVGSILGAPLRICTWSQTLAQLGLLGLAAFRNQRKSVSEALTPMLRSLRLGRTCSHVGTTGLVPLDTFQDMWTWDQGCEPLA